MTRLREILLPWGSQPQEIPEIDRDVWPGNSQIVLPSLGFGGVIGGAQTISGANGNAPFSLNSPVGRLIAWRPNTSTTAGEFYTWSTGNFDIGSNGSMIAIMSSPNWAAAIPAGVVYGGVDWGLALEATQTGAKATYVDNPPSAGFDASITGLPSLANEQFRAVGLTKSGNTITVFSEGRSVSTTGGNGGIRRSSGSGIGYGIGPPGDRLAMASIIAATSEAIPHSRMLELTASVDAPWQIFRRRIFVPVAAAGGATSLTVADASHAHTADSLTLTTSASLTIADASHAHSADSLTLTSSTALVVAEASHGHTADSPTLSTASALAVADADHAHTADALTLTAASALAVADATHAHTADNLALSTTGSASLAVADATHAHAADSVALTSASSLAVADALHGHAADNAMLSTGAVASLAVADATHGHAADGLDLSTATTVLIADALHGHTADGLALTVAAWLAVNDALHAHRVDLLALSFGDEDADPSRLWMAPAESRIWRVPAELRTHAAPPETRTHRPRIR